MDWECKYCKKKLKLKNKHTKSGHLAKCRKWKEWKSENLTYEKLHFLYIKSKMSLPEIKEHFNLDSVTTIWKELKKNSIPIKSTKEANKSEKSKEKRKQTHLKRYGYPHNFCKDSPSRKEWEDRLLKEEGITNVFQRKEVIEKIKNTIVTKYKNEDPRSPLIRGSKVYSSIHKEVVEELLKYNINLRIEHKIRDNKRTYFFDIIIENTNKLIEVNGDYWHGNPEIYKPNDLILKGSLKEYKVSDKWKTDKDKILTAEKLGYKVFIIWEKDLKENKEEVIKKTIDYIKAKDERNKDQIN